MDDYVGAAKAVGAEALLFTTGPSGTLRWEEAASAFAEAFGPVLANGPRRSDLPIGLENTGALRYDNGFVTTLADTVDLARSLGATVCVETWNCFMERNLAGTFRDAAGYLQHHPGERLRRRHLHHPRPGRAGRRDAPAGPHRR